MQTTGNVQIHWWYIFHLEPFTDELTEFINLFNSHDKSIKIDCNINETSVGFFYVTIFKGSGFFNHNILDTKVYFKETDMHELLHEKFFHPKHPFEAGILKSQLIRFLTICNNMEDFHEAVSILFTVLHEKQHHSDFSYRSKRDSWEIISSRALLLIPLGLH